MAIRSRIAILAPGITLPFPDHEQASLTSNVRDVPTLARSCTFEQPGQRGSPKNWRVCSVKVSRVCGRLESEARATVQVPGPSARAWPRPTAE